MDGDTAYLVGRAFARVLGGLRGKEPSRPPGRPRPRHAQRGAGDERPGPRGAGRRGLHGARRRNGRERRCSTSWSARGNSTAAPWSLPRTTRRRTRASSSCARGRSPSPATPGSATSAPRSRPGLPDPPGGGSVEAVDVYDTYHERVLGFIDPSEVKPLRVIVDGGNGMAGPMVGPLLERLGLDLVTYYWVPDGEFPDHEPNPLVEENRHSSWQGPRGGRGPRDRLGRRRRPVLLHRRRRACSSTATSSPRCSPGSSWRRSPARRIVYDVRASRAVPDTVRELGGTSYMNRVGHAFFKAALRERSTRRSAARSPATTTSATSGARTQGRSLRCWCSSCSRPRTAAVRAGRRVSRPVLHLRRDQLRGRRPGGQDAASSPSATRTPRSHGWTASRSTTPIGTSTSGPPIRSRCCGSTSSRSSPGRTWRRSGTKSCSVIRVVTSTEEALEQARDAGIHRLQIPTPFAVGRVNCYLLEDEPLTLVDTGPNSGKALDELERQLADLGQSLEDIELVVLTHQHIDHLGLVEIIADAIGRRRRGDRRRGPVRRELRRRHRARRPVRRRPDAPPRDPGGRGDRAALRLAELPRLGRKGRR